MKEELVFSALTPFHADVLSRLHKDAFQECWSVKEFQDLLSMPAAFGFLAEKNKKPIGFIICQGTDEEAEIITIATVQNMRRIGVAKKLLSCALKRVPIMFLEVAQDNEAAKAFYMKYGFTIVGLRPKYYKRGAGQFVDAQVMRFERA